MIININKLRCKYCSGPVVLNVNNIALKRGSLYFLLGLSGSGKSTLLESLGLMSKAIDTSTENDIQYFERKDSVINLLDIWQNGDAQISKFRRQNYSFIFQNTNLMPNFTAGENMAYTLLMEGQSMIEAKSKVVDVMEKLDLSPSLFDKPIQNLSGGQRQRLAFVRAFVSPFEVLFGDEPTGNLDAVTGRSLMALLKNYLQQNNKTGIIVSHDIALALEFADEILMINKTNVDGHIQGNLDDKNVLIKNSSSQWCRKEDNSTLKNDYLFIQNYLV